MISYGILAAAIAMLFFAFSDTLAKKVSSKLGSYESSLLIIGAGLIPLAASLFLVHPNVFSPTVVLVSIIAGVFLAGGFLFVYKSLETEQVTNTMVLLNLQYVLIVLFGMFVLSEKISLFQAASLIIIFAGVLLVTVTRDLKLNRMLLPAVIGNLCWTIALVILSYLITNYMGASTGAVFITRLISFVVAAAFFAFLVKRKTKRSNSRRLKALGFSLPVATGIFDGVGQLAFVFIILYKSVALGGAVLALEPVLVAIFGYFLYRDRLTHLQLIGMTLAILGGVAINF